MIIKEHDTLRPNSLLLVHFVCVYEANDSRIVFERKRKEAKFER